MPSYIKIYKSYQILPLDKILIINKVSKTALNIYYQYTIHIWAIKIYQNTRCNDWY